MSNKVVNPPAESKASAEDKSAGEAFGMLKRRSENQSDAAEQLHDERYAIRIARDGTWHYHNSPINRVNLVKLFASVLRRDDAGDYWLITPAERGRIVVEDAPFIAVDMSVSGNGRNQEVGFRTNLDHHVIAGPDHPIRVSTNPVTGEPAPYIEIENGLEARISRPVYYELVERGVTDDHPGEARFGIWSKGSFFVLGELPCE